MRIRRRAATLIELMISLGLTAVLITMLLGAYWQASRLDSQARAARTWVDSRQLVQVQLQRYLVGATLGPKDPIDDNKGPSPYFFYTSPEGLTWTAHTSASLDPVLSGDQLVRLYVDGRRQLCLKLWPLPTQENLRNPVVHQQVLAQNVASIQFEFYQPPAQAFEVPKPKDPKATETAPGWHPDWPIDRKALPAMVKIQVTYADGVREPLLLAFQIPEGSPLIVYSKDRQ